MRRVADPRTRAAQSRLPSASACWQRQQRRSTRAFCEQRKLARELRRVTLRTWLRCRAKAACGKCRKPRGRTREQDRFRHFPQALLRGVLSPKTKSKGWSTKGIEPHFGSCRARNKDARPKPKSGQYPQRPKHGLASIVRETKTHAGRQTIGRFPLRGAFLAPTGRDINSHRSAFILVGGHEAKTPPNQNKSLRELTP
jgi:hypothetical protein